MFPDGLYHPGSLCYNNRSTNSGLFVAASGPAGRGVLPRAALVTSWPKPAEPDFRRYAVGKP